MSRKREVLELLSADELRGLVDRFELEVKDRRARDGMIDTLSRSHRVQLAEPLAAFPRERLKELCRKLGLEDGGKEKAPIVERLLGRAAEPGVKAEDVEGDEESEEERGGDEVAATEQVADEKPKGRGRGKKAAGAGGGGDLGFEAKLWQMADKLRNNMDAAEYKHVVLGLIFLKYISDAFGELRERLVAQSGDGADPEDRDEYRAERVFWVPKDARWPAIQARAKEPRIGQLIDEAMTAIERDNPALKATLPKNYGRPGLDKQRLGELVGLGWLSAASREARYMSPSRTVTRSDQLLQRRL